MKALQGFSDGPTPSDIVKDYAKVYIYCGGLVPLETKRLCRHTYEFDANCKLRVAPATPAIDNHEQALTTLNRQTSSVTVPATSSDRTALRVLSPCLELQVSLI